MRDLALIEGWFHERFPRHPYVYFGLSGATLLYDALRLQPQSALAIPAYICPSLSAMGAAAGKKLIHIEVDPRTLHADPAHFAQDGAIVLVDHAFGYPFPSIARLRNPGTLIIEDCARALGVTIHGEPPGAASDWLLFSMYKTVRGSRNGAVLLTNARLAIATEKRRGRISIKERGATFPPARFLHHRWLRRSRFGPRPIGADPEFEIQRGLPSELCAARFWAELKDLEARTRMRREIADELTENLSGIPGIDCVQTADGCGTAGHFVSFAVRSGSRDQMITGLYRRGLFVLRTWDIVPGNYKSLESTFPSPPRASKMLAESMAHIPIDYFLKSSDRRQLIQALRDRRV